MHSPVPESVMNLYQQAFLSEHTGQENVAGINTHVSAIVQKMGSFASPTAQQSLMKTIEDVVYRQYLATFKGKNIHEADALFPKIRTARDKHAIEGTDRKAVFALIKKLHELRGCTAKLEAPYCFLQDVAAILNIFEVQYSEGTWSKTSIIQKQTFLCQFLEMISEFELKKQYYAVLSTFIESLLDPEPKETMTAHEVTDVHSKIGELYNKAVDQLSQPDEFIWQYYSYGCGPLQIVMDCLCLLYIWGDSTDHSNIRRLLQTFTYKGPDTSLREDNYVSLYDDGRVTLQINHVTKVDKTFQPMEVDLTLTNPKMAHILKLWRPIAGKFQSGSVFTGRHHHPKSTDTPNRSNPYVIFQYDYSTCNKKIGQLGAPVGTLHESGRKGWFQGNGLQKQAIKAATRMGYDEDMAKKVGSCNCQRHVEAAANRIVQAPTVEEEAANRARGRRRGSSGHALQTQYALDQRNPGDFSTVTLAQEELTGLSDDDLMSIEAA